MSDVQREQPNDIPRHESLTRHPIHATVEEAAHLRQVADTGDSPATPAIVVGVVAVFVLTIAAFLIFLAFGIAHFA